MPPSASWQLVSPCGKCMGATKSRIPIVELPREGRRAALASGHLLAEAPATSLHLSLLLLPLALACRGSGPTRSDTTLWPYIKTLHRAVTLGRRVRMLCRSLRPEVRVVDVDWRIAEHGAGRQ